MIDEAPTIAGERYRLVEVLGRGGMSLVWKAWDERLAVWRAVKILAPRGGDAVALRARFDAEARAMARIRHPHVLAVHDVGSDGDVHWIVMDLAEGGSLAERIERSELPPRQVCGLMCAVLDALGAAHAEGIVHRDVKPSNLMLDRAGTPFVADFGIARLTNEDTSLTRTGTGLGTQGYMAPEQRSGARGIDGRADVYGAGATLYALLTGQTPYDLHTEEARREQFRTVPTPLVEIISRATRWEPADRFPSTAAMRTALQAAAEELPEERPVPLGLRVPVETVPPPPRSATGDRTGMTWHDEPAPPPVVGRRAPNWAPVFLLPLAAGVLLGLVALRDAPPAAPRLAVTGDLFPVSREPLGTPVNAVAASPDGQRLAWATRRGVFSAGLDDGAVELLLPQFATSLAWPSSGLLVDTSDGVQRLVGGTVEDFVSNGSYVAAQGAWTAWVWKNTVWVRNADGEQHLLPMPGEPRSIAFSPDGTQLAVAVNSAGTELHAVEILRVPIEGGRALRVASETSFLQANLRGTLVWPEPDALWVGRTIRSELGPRAEIWRYPLEGEPSRLLGLPASSVTGMAHAAGVLAMILDSSQTDLVSLRGGTTERLTLDDGNDRDGALLPDGRMIWVTDRLGNFDLLVGRPGEEPTVFAATAHQETYPVPVPGGVLYWRSKVGGAEADLIRRADDGTETRLLGQAITQTERSFGRPAPVSAKVCCSEDRATCVLGRVESERMTFRLIDAATGRLGPPVASGAEAVYTRWVVPNSGEEVVYADPDRRALFSLRFDTGEEKRLGYGRNGRPHDVALAQDGGLWFSVHAERWELRHRALDGAVTVLAEDLGRIVQPFAGPDGAPIFTLGSEDSDVWAVRVAKEVP